MVFPAHIPEGINEQTLRLHKTKKRTIYTLHLGSMSVTEILLKSADGEIFRSRELQELVAPGCNYGYDVIEHIGMQRFLSNRTVEEVQEELAQRNVPVSKSEIGNLERRFLLYLNLAHRKQTEKITAFMKYNGGYILHVDGTVEGDSPVLFSGLDSLSGFVLHSVKMPSEKSDTISDFFSSVTGRYGMPIAIACDCSEAIYRAVKEVFEGNDIPVFVCHFHFLRDIGKDLLEDDYDIIRKRLIRHKICSKLRKQARRLHQHIQQYPDLLQELDFLKKRSKEDPDFCLNLPLDPTVQAYALIEWLFQGKRQGHGYGFPFDQPHLCFAQRLLELRKQLEQVNWDQVESSRRKRQSLTSLHGYLYAIKEDAVLKNSIKSCQEKTNLFNQLREAMEIAPPKKGKGLNCQASKSNINKIETQVIRFRKKVEKLAKDSLHQNPFRKMLVQMDKFWERLFCDPIEVETPDGKITIQPQRTNNIMEQFFRDIKRAFRRTTGNNTLNRILKTMPAEVTLVKNLKNEKYTDMLLGENCSLAELFATIDINDIRKEETKSKILCEKVPTPIRKLAKISQLSKLLQMLSLTDAMDTIPG